MRSGILPVLALGMLAASAGGAAARQGQAARIHGLVIEHGRGRPIPEVRVALTPGDLSATTSENGRFVLRDIPPGKYELRLERIGYVTRVDTAFIGEGLPINVTIELATAAIELDPIAVEVRSPDLEIAGVYDRLESLRKADYFTAKQIEDLKPVQMTDLFSRVPSAKVLDTGPGRRVIRFNRAGLDGPVCEPALYVDGALVRDNMTDGGGVVLDFNRVPPEQIAAIEVYVGALTPLQYRQNNCGSVLVWTKRGG
ncbi:MAG: TonB-dependent receptor [Gemmatimonadota bacterium]|jgi:hypothetical protein